MYYQASLDELADKIAFGLKITGGVVVGLIITGLTYYCVS